MAQNVCKKWYAKFVPQVWSNPIKLYIPMSELIGRRFKLAYYPEDQPKGTSAHTGPLYLAVATDKGSDQREHHRTYFVSAGSSAHHREFLWYLTKDRKIFADDPGLLRHQSSRMAGLASHRYHRPDYLGRTGSYTMATNVHNHENFWTLNHVGGGLVGHFKYTICLANNLFN